MARTTNSPKGSSPLEARAQILQKSTEEVAEESEVEAASAEGADTEPEATKTSSALATKNLKRKKKRLSTREVSKKKNLRTQNFTIKAFETHYQSQGQQNASCSDRRGRKTISKRTLLRRSERNFKRSPKLRQHKTLSRS
jgi:uncharacterized protein (DUF1501 family)